MVVRIRPGDAAAGEAVCVRAVDATTAALHAAAGEQRHSFDAVCGPAAGQEAVFRIVGRPMVENCLDGFNSTLMAFGQTGSGKTYTMTGVLPPADAGGALPEAAGLTPRIAAYLFHRLDRVAAQHRVRLPLALALALLHRSARLALLPLAPQLALLTQSPRTRPLPLPPQAAGECVQYECRLSMLEIYREELRDLLLPPGAGAAPRLAVREGGSGGGGVFVEGLTQESVGDAAAVLGLLRRGTAARRTAETRLNPESSRSHCLLTLTLERRGAGVATRTARLNLVDLAGERGRGEGGSGGGGLCLTLFRCSCDTALSGGGRTL